MIPVSIVIITKNEADTIENCIIKAKRITDDIVIIDNGSTDDTLIIAADYGCRIYKKPWQNYGANKNLGNELAKYNWILSIDADEIPDHELISSLHHITLGDANVVYDIRFCSYYGMQPVRYGNWGREHHIRLFNRNKVKWTETTVHETLILNDAIKIKKIKGQLHHYTIKDVEEYDQKSNYYAKLCAEQYFKKGRRANAVKTLFSPLFAFVKSYIILMGFLDGRIGWLIAKTNFINTRRKYIYLERIENYRQKKHVVKESFAIEY
jgi:glycosyltransferase involved in cell wall biosynthesis